MNKIDISSLSLMYEFVKMKSVLAPVLNDIFTAKTWEEAMQIVKNTLDSHDINPHDKFLILRRIETEPKLQTLIGLQSYLSNSIMKYEGGGVIGQRYSTQPREPLNVGEAVDTRSDAEYALEMIIGDYLAVLNDASRAGESDIDIHKFINGLKTIGQKLGINIKKYDVDKLIR